jgi:hypothetical protein
MRVVARRWLLVAATVLGATGGVASCVLRPIWNPPGYANSPTDNRGGSPDAGRADAASAADTGSRDPSECPAGDTNCLGGSDASARDVGAFADASADAAAPDVSHEPPSDGGGCSDVAAPDAAAPEADAAPDAASDAAAPDAAADDAAPEAAPEAASDDGDPEAAPETAPDPTGGGGGY